MNKITLQNRQVKFAWVALSAIALGGFYYVFMKKQTKQQTTPIKPPVSSQTHVDLKQNRFLSQTLAERRSKQIVQGTVTYKVDLFLKKGSSYAGLVSIKLQINHVEEDLFIDYRGKYIDGLIINGIKQVGIQWNQLFLIIPKEHLKKNSMNLIQIKFSNDYALDGTGLHSFIDTDQKQYLYSQCESYYCNRFFPCFDQPDIKGSLTFKLIAPKEWQVISNQNAVMQQQYDKQTFEILITSQPEAWVLDVFNTEDPQSYNFWVFGTTPLLPAYLYCIVAGEYWSIKSDLPGTPQTIYCRESLKEHLLKIKDFIFEVTMKSQKFYEEFFGVKFPFSKYDSVFVPEFNFGAMENPGCITFNDHYIYREQKVASSYTQLANTIAHEMAHMWFGNYVTMKWWNDLWLNESYADFISHFCLEHLEIKSIPLTNIGVMFNKGKGWGYREDQMVTTHPIAGDVANTEEAENIFDGITYAKGAAVMKQLLCIMGAPAFGKACGAHFKNYAWNNATLQDLINSLDVEFKQQKQSFTLQEWQQEWIQTAGLNEACPEWNTNDQLPFSTLNIHQSAALSSFPTLRRHKIKVAFFKEDGSIDVKDVIISNKPLTEIKYNASNNYKAVLLNYEDETFIKVLLDEVSLVYFRDNLHKIQDPLTRSIIWRAFFDQVRDGKISSEEYIQIVIQNLPSETADDIVSNQMGYLSAAVHSMTPKKYKMTLATRVFNFIVSQLKSIGNAQDSQSQNRRILFRDNLFSYTIDDGLIKILLSWKNNQNEDLIEVPLTNQCQWSIVQKVHGSKLFEEELRSKLFSEQSERDKSDMSQRMQKKCYALSATPEQLRILWDSYLDSTNKESSKLQSYSMSGFNNPRRITELQEYNDKFFDVLIGVFVNRSTDFSKTFYHSLFPQTDDLAYLKKQLNDILTKTPVSQVTLKIEITKSLDDIKRKTNQFDTFQRRAQIAQPQQQL